MGREKILQSIDEGSILIRDLHTRFRNYLRNTEYNVVLPVAQENKLFLMESSLKFLDKNSTIIEEIIIRIRNYDIGFELIFGGKYRYQDGDENKYENPPLSILVRSKKFIEKPIMEKTLIDLPYRLDLIGKRKNWHSLKRNTYNEIRTNVLNEIYVKIKEEIDNTLKIV